MNRKRVALSVLLVFLTFTVGQTVTSSDSGGNPPQIAFDIPKSDIDMLLKNSTATDQPIRVVDMGKYNMEVAIVHRGATKDAPGAPVSGPYHDQTAETYIMLSGAGTLATGGTIMDKKQSTNYSIQNGPGGNGTPGNGSYSRKVVAGDIIIIPPGVLHVWTEIPEQVTYLSVRPDPDRVLPAGYVSPLLLKNQMPPTK